MAANADTDGELFALVRAARLAVPGSGAARAAVERVPSTLRAAVRESATSPAATRADVAAALVTLNGAHLLLLCVCC